MLRSEPGSATFRIPALPMIKLTVEENQDHCRATSMELRSDTMAEDEEDVRILQSRSEECGP